MSQKYEKHILWIFYKMFVIDQGKPLFCNEDDKITILNEISLPLFIFVYLSCSADYLCLDLLTNLVWYVSRFSLIRNINAKFFFLELPVFVL